MMEWIYRRAMQQRRTANLRRRESEVAPCPIVSVGNLTTGGTGKTPAVQWLGRALQNEGKIVGIASRGYGGSRSEKGAFVSDGRRILLNAAEAGDEAVLHARNLPGAIVAIAKDRHQAVEICVGNGAEIVILDDGFQFWSLPRAFDLVLMDARQPLGNGRLLPLGRLREEPATLKRADAILLTRANRASEQELEQARHQISRWTNAPLYLSNHKAQDLRDEKDKEIVSLNWLARRPIKAFAGLANNDQFYAELERLGAQIIRLRHEHGDHHKWRLQDFQWFEAAPSINLFQQGKFEGIPVVTTEKDAVKIERHWFAEQLLSLRIALHVEREAELQKLIFAKLLYS